MLIDAGTHQQGIEVVPISWTLWWERSPKNRHHLKHQKIGAAVTSIKPVDQPHSFSLTTRNSSIELLRLVCMLMIVGYHYAYTSAGHWIAEQPFSLAKLIYQCLMGGGWVGNFVFFTISIWFLLDRKQTLQSNLRRVWILERELLFWSIVLFLITIALRKHDVFTGSLSTRMLALRCFLPLSLNIWWYPTSYALFLIFLPFLNVGMRRLSQRQHCQLACICLLLWGLLGLIPKLSYNLTESTVFVFIYWYILISYYRWHMKPFSTRRCWPLIGNWGKHLFHLSARQQSTVFRNRESRLRSIVHL